MTLKNTLKSAVAFSTHWFADDTIQMLCPWLLPERRKHNLGVYEWKQYKQNVDQMLWFSYTRSSFLYKVLGTLEYWDKLAAGAKQNMHSSPHILFASAYSSSTLCSTL